MHREIRDDNSRGMCPLNDRLGHELGLQNSVNGYREQGSQHTERNVRASGLGQGNKARKDKWMAKSKCEEMKNKRDIKEWRRKIANKCTAQQAKDRQQCNSKARDPQVVRRRRGRTARGQGKSKWSK